MQNESTPYRPPFIDYRPLHILHLDDQKLFATGVEKIITVAFPLARITNIKNGYEALGFVVNSLSNSVIIDLIITDYNHPGLNGVEFCKNVRVIERSHGKIPIIFLTMVDNVPIKQQALSFSNVKFLLKVTEADEINWTVMAVI